MTIIERRTTVKGAPSIELRAEGDSTTARGYFAVHSRYSENLGGYVEVIEPGAFDRAIGGGAEVVALYNHDPDHLLGSTRAGTLTVGTDDVGGWYEIDMPATTLGRDLSISIERRDLAGSSFSFTLARGDEGQEWDVTEEGFPLRRVKRVARLFDVGPVTFPAYESTKDADMSVALRSLAELRDMPADEVVTAAAENRLADLILPSEPSENPAVPSAASRCAHVRQLIDLDSTEFVRRVTSRPR